MVVLIYLWNNASFKIPSIFKHSLLPKFSQKLSKTTYLKGRGCNGSIPRTMLVVFIVATRMGTISMKRCYNIQSSSDSDLVEFQCRRSHDT